MKRLAIVSFLTLIAAAALAAPFTIPKVYAPGDAITAADRNTELAAIASSVNNITAAQITDSTITGGKLAAGSIPGSALAPGCITYAGKHIDTGAIFSDTQFHPSWTIPTNRFVSTNTDTAQNWIKMVNGYYFGDGTDTRTIYCTQQGAGHIQGGQRIPFTVTRVEIVTNYNAGATAEGCYFAASDVRPDSVTTFASIAGTMEAFNLIATSVSGITWSPGTYPTLVNNSDSHGFRVRDGGSGLATANESGYLYRFTAWGY